jgi:hypothetical protein
MRIHEMTAAECDQVLAGADFGRLACARHDQPYIVPIHFYFDEQERCLYSFATLGRKIEWMRENPKVCVAIDEIADRFQWTTVLVFGRYEEVRETDDKSQAHRRALQLFRQRPEWWLPAAGKVAGGEEHHSPVVYRIHIDRLSGRRAGKSI